MELYDPRTEIEAGNQQALVRSRFIVLTILRFFGMTSVPSFGIFRSLAIYSYAEDLLYH